MEITSNAVQTVEQDANILFTDIAVAGCPSIMHREGSGIVTLRGLTQQARARFRLTFGANIAIPEGGTVEPISLAVAITGEPVPTSSMIVTPAAVDNYFNVSSGIFLDVPAGCCLTVSIENNSNQSILVQNANLIVERVA